MVKFYIFVSGEHKPDFVSKRIMKRFKTDYSHIGLVVEIDGHKTIYHSVGKGFSTESYEEFLKEHYIYEKDITKYIYNFQFALGYLTGRLGIEYSYSQYLGFLFPMLQRLVRNKKEKGICSEEAARFLNECCQECLRVNKKQLDFISPKEVWEHLQGLH